MDERAIILRKIKLKKQAIALMKNEIRQLIRKFMKKRLSETLTIH